jgi:diguanylate cyclase (GGDEF)-like protein/PAS domain S-box-containing protein
VDGAGAIAAEAGTDALLQEVGRLERRMARERNARKQAEALIEEKSRELWEQRERYRLLAENASDVVFQLSPDDCFVWISPSMLSILGWEPNELLGRAADEFVHPDDVRLVAGAFEQPEEGVAQVDELRFRRVDGAYLWMSGRARELADADGNLIGRVVALRDVDELVTARLALRADRLQLKATLASLLDPHVLLVAVRDGEGHIIDFVYTSANNAACEYMRMSPDQLEGARLLDLLPGQAGSGMLAMYAEAVDSGQALVLDDYAYPHEIMLDERRYDIRAIRVGDALSFTWRDVSDRFAAVQELARQEKAYRLLADNSSDVVMHVRNGLILWVSSSLTDMLGWTPDDWTDGQFDDFIHEEDRARLLEARAAIHVGATVVERFRARSADGPFHWIEIHARPYLDDEGTQDGAAVSFRTVDAEVRNAAELERRAQYDELTGLVNRKELLDRFSTILTNQRRPGDFPAAIFCDIDDFKSVNDTFGHATGDELLRCVAGRITEAVRSSDMVARVGGDEIVVILAGAHDLAEAGGVAEKIRLAIREPMAISEGSLTATASIGVTLARPGEQVDAVLARADEAMYRAKQGGRDQVLLLDS